jgi:Transposase and inactivated derivatives
MKPLPIELREKVVKAYEQGNTSIKKLAARFDVSKSFVERLVKRKQITGDIQPLRQGGSQKSELNGYSSQLHELVEKYPDSTLSEYCEYWGNIYAQWISTSIMCRELKRLGLKKKKDATKQSSGDRPGAKIKRRILGKSEEYRVRKPGIYR